MSSFSSSDFDGKSIVAYYDSLPDPLKDQLKVLENRFRDDSDIKPVAQALYQQYGKKHRHHPHIKSIIFRVAMLKVISPDYLFNKKYFQHVYAYDDKGHVVTFDKIMTTGRHVVLLLGRLPNGIQVVVKWYQSHKRDTQYEIDIYKKLRGIGTPMPWFSSSYKFWNAPVLVMEKLEAIDASDNEYEVGKQVLEQLPYLHSFGVHNDLKPGNILARHNPDGSKIYFVIDYGGVATERLGKMYKRWIWSPKWTSQISHKPNQQTSSFYDAVELGYTMKSIANFRTGEKEIREGFRGTLAKYMNRVAKIDKVGLCEKDYHDLISVLKENC